MWLLMNNHIGKTQVARKAHLASKAQWLQKRQAAKESAEGQDEGNFIEELELLRNELKTFSGLPRAKELIKNCHEGGWSALGVLEGGEVATTKLNDAIDSVNLYSALFLSVELGLLYDPPDGVIERGGGFMQAYFFFMWISVTSHAMAIVMGLPIKGTINNCAREADKLAFLSSSVGDGVVTKSTILAAVGIFAVCIGGNIGCACTYNLSEWQTLIIGIVQLVFCVLAWLPSQFEIFQNHIMHYWIKKAGDDPLDTSFEQDIAPIKEILLALLQEREDFLLSKDGLPNPDTASLDSLRKDTYRESKSEDKNQEEEYAPAAAAPSKAETEMNEQGSTNPLRASLHVS